MKEKFCPDYCGLACVNGTCPKIENKWYRCNDCWFYEGCKDCYFKGTDMCNRKNEKGE